RARVRLAALFPLTETVASPANSSRAARRRAASIRTLGRGGPLAEATGMRRSPQPRGFSLLETMIAMVLVAFAMTALVMAFGSSSKFGALGRRQANAVALGRSIAGQLSVAAYTDARLVNNNTQNDATFADPSGFFAQRTLPVAPDPNAPDNTIGAVTVGNETYQVFVNVAPLMDPVNVTLEQGRQFA